MPRASFTPQGLNRDIPASDLDPNIYTAASNINFRRGLAQRASRGVQIFEDITFTEPPVYLTDTVGSTGFFWLYYADDGVTQSIWATDGQTHKEITPAVFVPGVSQVNAVTTGKVSGFPFLNWGPQAAFWNRDFATPAVMLPFPGLDAAGDPDNTFVPTARAMRSHQNRILALNTIDDAGTNFVASEQTVLWSALPQPADAFPNDWFPRVTNSAGGVQLSGGGPVIDGFSLRSSFIVYLQDRTYIMDEIGGSFVFLTRKLSSSTGVLTRNCVAATPRGHVVMSADDVYLNDGSNFKSIVDNVVKREIFTNLGDNFQNAFVVYYASRAEVWICIPTGSDVYPSLAFILDEGVGKWGVRELPRIAAGATGPIPFPSGAATDWDGQADTWDTVNRIWNQAAEASAASGLILADPDLAGSGAARRFISIDNLVPGDSADMFTSSSIERQDLSLDAPGQTKTVRRIWPRVEGTAGDVLTVSVGVRDSLDGAPIVYKSAPFIIGVDEKVDLFNTGKFITVKVEQGAGSAWLMPGFDIEYDLRGQF